MDWDPAAWALLRTPLGHMLTLQAPHMTALGLAGALLGLAKVRSLGHLSSLPLG